MNNTKGSFVDTDYGIDGHDTSVEADSKRPENMDSSGIMNDKYGRSSECCESGRYDISDKYSKMDMDSGDFPGNTAEATSFKDKVMKIEQEWSRIDRQDDSAVFWNLTAEMYKLLIGEGMKYFLPIYNRSGICYVDDGKEMCDYLVDLWEEAKKSYDPEKGHLFQFLTTRFSNRLKDAARKERIVRIDEKNEDGSDKDVNLMDLKAAKEYGYESDDGFIETMVMDEQLYELASMILNYVGRESGRKKEKLLYDKLFYSSAIISYIKLLDEDVGFRHERDIMEAMHFLFTNFCTAKGEKYKSRSALTVSSIIYKKLGLKGDIFPREKVTEKNRMETLKIPLENEVVRGYLEREENISVTPARISQRMKEYRDDMRALLREKDLLS